MHVSLTLWGFVPGDLPVAPLQSGSSAVRPGLEPGTPGSTERPGARQSRAHDELDAGGAAEARPGPPRSAPRSTPAARGRGSRPSRSPWRTAADSTRTGGVPAARAAGEVGVLEPDLAPGRRTRPAATEWRSRVSRDIAKHHAAKSSRSNPSIVRGKATLAPASRPARSGVHQPGSTRRRRSSRRCTARAPRAARVDGSREALGGRPLWTDDLVGDVGGRRGGAHAAPRAPSRRRAWG